MTMNSFIQISTTQRSIMLFLELIALETAVINNPLVGYLESRVQNLKKIKR